MDWIKIKACHISSELTDAQVGALVRYQLLVARYERVPMHHELTREVSSKALASLGHTLTMLGASLEHIASKVLEDVEVCNRQRVSNKERKQKQRGTNKNVTRDGHEDGHNAEKRREEKIREDENITPIIPLDDNQTFYVAKDFTLQNCRTKAALLTFINKMNIQPNEKKELRIMASTAMKDQFNPFEVQELIETYQTSEEYENEQYRNAAEGILLDGNGDNQKAELPLQDSEPAKAIPSTGSRYAL